MKRKSILTLALVAGITSTAFAGLNAPLPEFKTPKQLAEWRAEMAAKAEPKTTATQDTAFYTGKPYLAYSGNYAFKYRSYKPELARWTSEDPSGFPDGANQFKYGSNSPVLGSDPDGLAWKAQRFYGAPEHLATDVVTPGGRLFFDTSQWVGDDYFGISNYVKDGLWSSWIDSDISGSVRVSPGGNEIMLVWNKGTEEKKPNLTVTSAVAVANIVYTDNNRTVSFNFTYAGNPSLSGLTFGPAGVTSNSMGFATGFGTLIYTLVE